MIIGFIEEGHDVTDEDGHVIGYEGPVPGYSYDDYVEPEKPESVPPLVLHNKNKKL